MAKLKINSCRSIAPSALRPALAHRSQRRYPCHLVRCQHAAFRAGVLLDALGAAESQAEGRKEGERMDDCHVEAEE